MNLIQYGREDIEGEVSIDRRPSLNKPPYPRLLHCQELMKDVV